ncbi:YqiA/YcfP family alpha/beta fold hydrolase, partial [Staphylococcus aureus]
FLMIRRPPRSTLMRSSAAERRQVINPGLCEEAMINYLHGFDSNSPGNHEKALQLQFIDPDVRLISYSTRHPKHDMQHLLKEVDKMLQLNADDRISVDLGGRRIIKKIIKEKPKA